MDKVVKIRGFVKEFTEDKVTCVMVMSEEAEVQETRLFDLYPLFAGMDLFEHKNILLEIVTEGNSQTCSCLESSESTFQQIMNAWTTIIDI